MQFSRIKERVRANTGWSSTSDLSTARLEEAVNHVYTRHIPNVLNWEGLQEWVYIDLVNTDSGDYPFYTKILDASGGSALGTRVRSLEPPFVLLITATTSAILDQHFVPYEFWDQFVPVTTETKDQPTHVMIDKKTLYVRPVPDDTYVIKVLGNLRPADMANAGDEPTEDWAEAIIAGATAKLLEDDEDEAAAFWWAVFNNELGIETKDEAISEEPEK